MRSCVGLSATDDLARFRLDVTPADCAEHGMLYAGVALASVIEAAETTSGRDARWATVQLTRAVTAPTTLDLSVHLGHVGRRSTQAQVVAEEAGTPALLALVATSEPAATALSHTWHDAPPDLMALERHPPQPVGEPHVAYHRFDVVAKALRGENELDGRLEETGRSAMWVRLRGHRHGRAAELGLMVDATTWGLQSAIGASASVLTYDNTIRIVQTQPTDWVLLELLADAVADGFGHATVRMWSESGALLAIGSQSARLARATEAREHARAASNRRRTRALWDDLLDGRLKG